MTEAVIVNMTPDTVSALQNGGYRLYGFLAVRTENRAALPVLWLATTAYSARTMIAPADGYCIYTSSSSLQPGQRIFMGFTTAINLGQCLEVDQTGTGKVVQGRDGFISIDNSSSTAFVTGLAQGSALNAEATPFFAEPLYGNQTNFFQPTSKILLVLSTQAIAPGTVVDALPLPMERTAVRAAQTIGILIEASSERTVNFDINKGWSWGGATWASLVDVSTGLTNALIEN